MKVVKAFISQVLNCLINFLPSPRWSQPETIIKEDVLVVQVSRWATSPSDAAGTCAAVRPSALLASAGAAGLPPGKAAPQSGAWRWGTSQGAVLPGMQFYLERCL